MKSLLLIPLLLLSVACGLAQKKDAPVYSTKAGAIGGYDPVAYFIENKPVKGQAALSYDWHGVTWHFASATHRDLFRQNPEKYAPQYGGWCAYGWSRGYPAKTEPDAWSIVGGRLYLNYNRDVRETWNEKQAEYILKADQNYAKSHPDK